MDPEFGRKRKFLQRVALFSDIARKDLGRLFHSLIRRTYQPGDILFEEGETGRALFILAAGQVEILRQTPGGEPVRVAILNPGDYFGEMSLLDERPRTATVVAVGPVEVYLLYKTEFEKIVHTEPRVAAAIMTHLAALLAARLRAVHEVPPVAIASTLKLAGTGQ